MKLARMPKKDLKNRIDDYMKQTPDAKNLAGFAVFMGLDKKTTLDLLRKKDALDYIMTYLEQDLIENGLRGKYNTTMASFLLKSSFGYGDKDEEKEEDGCIRIEMDGELEKYAK